MDNNRRLIVLGLDSLPPGLTKTLAKTGVMPFINELMEKGSFGRLESVVPAHTGSGWNSAWTGQPPVRHGYFSFYYFDQDNIMQLSSSDRLKVPALWQMLNAHGRKVVVINSPMQYPATKLDGIMVSGFMAPSIKSVCTYPLSFRDKLAEEIPDYLFDVPWEKHKQDDKTFERNMASVIKVFHQRVKAARLAMERGSWDVLMVVFKSIDNMLHFTWDYLSDDCPARKRHELTLEAFRVLDDACKELALVGGYPDTNMLIFSDHGHGALEHRLYVNRLLSKWGFLEGKTKFNRRLYKHITSIRKRLKIGKFQKKLSSDIGTRMKIMWNKSKAVMVQHGIIFLNVRGRQPKGVVWPEQYQSLREEIANRLASLKNKNDGTALIQRIECPKEASAKRAGPGELVVPDIVFEPADGIVLCRSAVKGKGRVFESGNDGNSQGCHRIDGIILGSGPAFAKGVEIEGDLYDIAPTVMAACGLPIPCGLVGKPIVKLLRAETEIRFDSKETLLIESQETLSEAYSTDDEEVIRRRLADLGYID